MGHIGKAFSFRGRKGRRSESIWLLGSNLLFDAVRVVGSNLLFCVVRVARTKLIVLCSKQLSQKGRSNGGTQVVPYLEGSFRNHFKHCGSHH